MTPAMRDIAAAMESAAQAAFQQQGLSPPMRGNQVHIQTSTAQPRSIPAHAGKPSPHSNFHCSAKVYPRPCGETRLSWRRLLTFTGLSPPMRGNQAYRSSGEGHMGSIPAHAGKPSRAQPFAGPFRVYPRPCGETRIISRASGPAQGLSPPMRGNHPLPGQYDTCSRSIPAHAGKPYRLRQVAAPPRVYPRPCGETRLPFVGERPDQGLSPPMRGNRFYVARSRGRVRSIPAHAGKPGASRLERMGDRVYPRPCGETR